MKRYITIVLTILMLTLSLGLQAQTIGYEYDASGNRILRNTVVLKSIPTKAAKIDSTKQAEIQELEKGILVEAGELSFMVYPNPTQGQLRLQIKGNVPKKSGQLTLFNSLGNSVLHKATTGDITDIDMSFCPVGSYVLILQLEGKRYDWKIMKE